MKVGEIKQAIQELADENTSLKSELFQTKVIAYRLMLHNMHKMLDSSECEMIESHSLRVDMDAMEGSGEEGYWEGYED